MRKLSLLKQYAKTIEVEVDGVPHLIAYRTKLGFISYIKIIRIYKKGKDLSVMGSEVRDCKIIRADTLMPWLKWLCILSIIKIRNTFCKTVREGEELGVKQS